MASSSFNMEDLSLKFRMMVEYMKKLEDKIEKIGGGLKSMRIDSQSGNAPFKGHKEELAPSNSSF
ncbi:hypothetical protein CR513_36335, partial [Mucuna pruriens]